MLTEKQLQERVKYIGASDAAGVLGLSRWSTQLSVWAQKTGQVPPDRRDSLAIKMGNRLEEVVGELFTEKTGLKVKRVPDTAYHPEYSFIAANLDYVTEEGSAVVEAKTAASWKLSEWKDDNIPTEYAIQALWQMAVTGKRKAFVACLIGNQAFEVREVLRDEKIINEIVKKGVDFWENFVKPKVMPWSITRKDGDTLQKLFPLADSGKVLNLGDEAARIIEALEGFKADYKNLEGLIDEKENELKALLKDAETGLTELHRVSWKNRIDKRFDTATFKAEKPLIYGRYLKDCPKRIFSIKPREDQ